jgi:hypothetical protein
MWPSEVLLRAVASPTVVMLGHISVITSYGLINFVVSAYFSKHGSKYSGKRHYLYVCVNLKKSAFGLELSDFA